MPKYVIERRIAGAGNLTAADLQGIAARSCAVLNELGPSVQWLESQVTEDTVYCLYIAPDETLLREHARRGGFPVDRIARVRATIDPTTAG